MAFLLELTDDLLVHIFNLHLCNSSWHRARWLACCNRRLPSWPSKPSKLTASRVRGDGHTSGTGPVRVHGVDEREEEDDGEGGARVPRWFAHVGQTPFSTRSANTLAPKAQAHRQRGADHWSRALLRAQILGAAVAGATSPRGTTAEGAEPDA